MYDKSLVIILFSYLLIKVQAILKSILNDTSSKKPSLMFPINCDLSCSSSLRSLYKDLL